jgi:hypothetical protein
MKLDRPLDPSLEDLEHRLFGVTDVLIDAVERNQVPEAIAKSVRKSEEWTARSAPALLVDNQQPDLPIDVTEIRMPDFLADMIRREVEAREAMRVAGAQVPASGVIVEMTQIRTPREGQLDWFMQTPLYALLDVEAEGKEIWHGWLVSGEPDYASWWDFVLQEEDRPFTPQASVVQVWNPVRIYLPMITRVVSCLSPYRLQAVRALAAEFVGGVIPSDVRVWPGRVAARDTLGGLRVATGSPLGDGHDPRHRYQHLLFHAAEAVRAPARLALAESVRAPSARSAILDRLRAWVQIPNAGLALAPRVAGAMSTQEDIETDILWDGLARVCILELLPDGAGRAEIHATSEVPVIVELRVAGHLEHRATIDKAGEASLLEWDSDETAALTLEAPDGRRIELQLND